MDFISGLYSYTYFRMHVRMAYSLIISLTDTVYSYVISTLSYAEILWSYHDFGLCVWKHVLTLINIVFFIPSDYEEFNDVAVR